jgi:hypothetical protein
MEFRSFFRRHKILNRLPVEIEFQTIKNLGRSEQPARARASLHWILHHGEPGSGQKIGDAFQREQPPFPNRLLGRLIVPMESIIESHHIIALPVLRSTAQMWMNLASSLLGPIFIKAGLPTIGLEAHDRRLQDRNMYISWESTKAEEKRQEHGLNNDLEIKNMIWLLKIQSQVPSIARNLNQNHDWRKSQICRKQSWRLERLKQPISRLIHSNPWVWYQDCSYSDRT